MILQDWIPVIEKMPELRRGRCSDEILMVIKIDCAIDIKPFIEQGIFIRQKNGKQRWRSNGGHQLAFGEVLYWMPLPLLPEGLVC